MIRVISLFLCYFSYVALLFISYLFLYCLYKGMYSDALFELVLVIFVAYQVKAQQEAHRNL